MYNFYNNLYHIFSLIIIFLYETRCTENDHIEISDKGIDPINPSSVGLQFFVTVNNTSNQNDYEIEFNPDRCCVEINPKELDCHILEIYGDFDVLPKNSIKTFKIISPVLNPVDRKGSCVVHLDSKAKDLGITMRHPVKIDFDTKIRKRRDNNDELGTLEDSVRNSDDCETYYNGQRSYYNENLKKCVQIPSCISSDATSEFPSIIYNPMNNECVEFHSQISDEDVDYIKTHKGPDVFKRSREPKDILIIKNTQYQPSGLLNDYKKLGVTEKNIMASTMKTGTVSDKHHGIIKKFFCYLKNNKYTLTILSIIVLLQCCFISMMGYCIISNCKRCKKKKTVESKYFNYVQDASVTTPLICTSNIDTETTDFMSESSNNVHNKIKYYKSMQNPETQQINNMKKCLSDDILSKCITRRDWKSHAITKSDSNKTDRVDLSKVIDECLCSENETTEYSTNYTLANNCATKSQVRISYENEKTSKYDAVSTNSDIPTSTVKDLVKNLEVNVHKVRKEIASKDTSSTGLCDDEMKGDSEKEIECHSYTNVESKNTGFKRNSSKDIGFVSEVDKKKRNDILSKLTDSGAQAYFSNDSIDDLLSERGMLLLPGDNISKYSFNSVSNGSKTSYTTNKRKGNVLKNVLSILRRNSKHGPSSDPGVKGRSKEELDIELLHMSQASVYSSSNNAGSDCLSSFTKKMEKGSRTSF